MLKPVNIHKLNNSEIPDCLHNLERPPKQLFYSGIAMDNWLGLPKVGIVGSRKMSAYGAYAAELFASALARAGVVIISGLAYGVDAAAHKAALAAGGRTVAVLPTAIGSIYPTSHLNLSRQILQSGGLISEYAPDDPIYKTNFTDRNRLIAGLSDALLIPEAAVNSGSLHTARFALEQGKTVMAVPGNINSPYSEGCNNLIKSGALPVTTAEDVFAAIGLNIPSRSARKFIGGKQEQKVYELIAAGITDQEEIALAAKLDAPTMAGVLTGLEINGYVRPLGAGQWSLS
jgi:DNA processing protein